MIYLFDCTLQHEAVRKHVVRESLPKREKMFLEVASNHSPMRKFSTLCDFARKGGAEQRDTSHDDYPQVPQHNKIGASRKCEYGTGKGWAKCTSKTLYDSR